MIRVNKFVIICFGLFLSTGALAQKIDSQNTVNCIKEGAINFLIHINRIEKTENIEDLYDNIGVVEISDNKILGYKLNGIYRFTNYTSHRADYLLLKKGRSYKILSLLNLSNTFNDVTKFLEELNYTKEDTFRYLELVLKEVKKNNFSKWKNQVLPREQIWVNCDGHSSN